MSRYNTKKYDGVHCFKAPLIRQAGVREVDNVGWTWKKEDEEESTEIRGISVKCLFRIAANLFFDALEVWEMGGYILFIFYFIVFSDCFGIRPKHCALGWGGLFK